MLTVKINPKLELSYLVVGDMSSPKTAIVIHGIMGSKRNWLLFITGLAKTLPQWKFIIYDLRNHGESSKHVSPFDLPSAASDIVKSLDKLNIKPNSIIGHSFGGKVALFAAEKIKSISSVFLLDCPPGILNLRPLNNDEKLTALQILDILEKIPWPINNREKLVKTLLQNQVGKKVAFWMTTNLVQKTNGLELIFSPNELKQMLESFLEIDAWDKVKELSKRCQIHLVSAEFGGRVLKEDKIKLQKLAPNSGYFHTLKNSGHFVQADNPSGLIDILKKNLL